MSKPLSWIARMALCAAIAFPSAGFSADNSALPQLAFPPQAEAPVAPAVGPAALAEWPHDEAPAAPRREVTFAERVEQAARRTAERMAKTEREVPIRVTGVAYQVASAGGSSAKRNYRAEALTCLSEALYFEARGEGAKGQMAVAEVILNRVDSVKFPNSVCGVVKQSNRRGCQFSYVCNGRSKRISEPRSFARVQAVARKMLAGEPRRLTDGATYFHTPKVRPSWSHRFVRTARIGSHIFYRTGTRVASN